MLSGKAINWKKSSPPLTMEKEDVDSKTNNVPRVFARHLVHHGVRTDLRKAIGIELECYHEPHTETLPQHGGWQCSGYQRRK